MSPLTPEFPPAAAIAPLRVGPGDIAFVCAPTRLAADSRARLVARYGDCPLPEAGCVVALGGDGFMLETLHKVLGTRCLAARGSGATPRSTG